MYRAAVKDWKTEKTDKAENTENSRVMILVSSQQNILY